MWSTLVTESSNQFGHHIGQKSFFSKFVVTVQNFMTLIFFDLLLIKSKKNNKFWMPYCEHTNAVPKNLFRKEFKGFALKFASIWLQVICNAFKSTAHRAELVRRTKTQNKFMSLWVNYFAHFDFQFFSSAIFTFISPFKFSKRIQFHYFLK